MRIWWCLLALHLITFEFLAFVLPWHRGFCAGVEEIRCGVPSQHTRSLIPSDFHCFGPLAIKRFAADAYVKQAHSSWQLSFNINFSYERMRAATLRWDKCLNHNGGCLGSGVYHLPMCLLYIKDRVKFSVPHSLIPCVLRPLCTHSLYTPLMVVPSSYDTICILRRPWNLSREMFLSRFKLRLL